MRRLVKRAGAVGAVLLLLNEIRGVLVVGAMLNTWAQTAQAHPQLGALANLIACAGANC